MVIEECDLAVRFKKNDSFVKNNRMVKRDYNGEIYSIENDSAYNDEKGNAIPVSLFNVRCQNDDGKDFSFPRYAEELAQFLNINSLDNFGQFNDKINKNSPLYYYSDSNQTP